MLAGQAYHTASLAPANAVLSLAVIDRQYAAPGTEVTVSWSSTQGTDGPGRGPRLPAHPRHGGARALQRARPHQLPGSRLTGAALSPEPMPALACWPPCQAIAGMAVASLGLAYRDPAVSVTVFRATRAASRSAGVKPLVIALSTWPRRRP